ncbi:MarR family transcriptional regulator [Streptomyces sp. TRM 70361]|uniref:MarR family winged helix-turn-helix transcriptional regulator n=1 Tax=Streptomyces sp. TRM 70361 TaxID=3116553 RepID=UPI002E7C24E9|nr:MarR family transcriptional regulator [Streptomyces sp. TRM 70361]MEE1938264.1 MarR family transcriptional regulator [Streptomyces sp. TRM 70361]
MPRGLDREEQATWRSFLLASRLLFDQLEREMKQDAALSFSDYELLSRLSRAPGRSMRMADVAAACVFDRSRLSHAIDRLVRNGWVCRVPCPSTSRGQLACLTDEGLEKVRQADRGHVEQLRSRVLDRLTDEQKTALREVSEVLATGILDRPKLVSMGWPVG